MWRRHEIENYLLHPAVVLALFKDYRTTLANAWAAALPTTEPDVSTLMQSLARPLLENHTGEVLEDELFALLDKHRLRFRVPTPPAPAGLPAAGQNEWLQALQQEATDLVSRCNAAAGLPNLETAAIQTRYHELLAEFQAPAFPTSGDYLALMGGHAFVAALCRHLKGPSSPAGLDQDFLAGELLRVLKDIYQPNTIYQPDDFAELANMLRQY
jgi:hypothetical protein